MRHNLHHVRRQQTRRLGLVVVKHIVERRRQHLGQRLERFVARKAPQTRCGVESHTIVVAGNASAARVRQRWNHRHRCALRAPRVERRCRRDARRTHERRRRKSAVALGRCCTRRRLATSQQKAPLNHTLKQLLQVAANAPAHLAKAIERDAAHEKVHHTQNKRIHADVPCISAVLSASLSAGHASHSASSATHRCT
jgi:hypothetical protein